MFYGEYRLRSCLTVIHRSRSGLHCLPSGYSDDAFATVLDRLLFPDAHSAQCRHTCRNVVLTVY